jgi:hypothetical protein
MQRFFVFSVAALYVTTVFAPFVLLLWVAVHFISKFW